MREGTIGPEVIDISKLYGETGRFTYDPGFTSTASCESKITFIDGDEGILLYRGYPIEQLAEHGDFLETCYLLLYGELPTAAQKADFDHRVTYHTMVHEQMNRFFTGFRRDAHPMAIMCGVVGAMSAFYHDSTDIIGPLPAHGRVAAHDRQDADDRGDGVQVPHRPALRLSAQRARLRLELPAHVLRRAVRGVQGQSRSSRAPWTASSSSTPITSRTPRPRRSVSPARRAPIPSPASPPASPVSGAPPMAAPTRRRSTCCRRSARSTASREYIARAKDKNDPFRLMGFGHRVYKHYDPRAKIMQKTCHEVLVRARHPGRSAARGRHGARADRAHRRVLHREEALSRTSTSIRASRSRRSASRRRCSRCSSRSPAPSAGSPSGRR